MNEGLAELYKARIAARGAMRNPVKKSEGYGYDYADLSEVIGATIDALHANDLDVVQEVLASEADVARVRTTLIHASGQSMGSEGSIPIGKHSGMSAEQCAGTAISYLRRYAWLAICGLPQGDSDGAAPKTQARSKTAGKVTGIKGIVPPRPSGDPPINAKGESLSAATPEVLRGLAAGEDKKLKLWATYLLAGGTA